MTMYQHISESGFVTGVWDPQDTGDVAADGALSPYGVVSKAAGAAAGAAAGTAGAPKKPRANSKEAQAERLAAFQAQMDKLKDQAEKRRNAAVASADAAKQRLADARAATDEVVEHPFRSVSQPVGEAWGKLPEGARKTLKTAGKVGAGVALGTAVLSSSPAQAAVDALKDKRDELSEKRRAKRIPPAPPASSYYYSGVGKAAADVVDQWLAQDPVAKATVRVGWTAQEIADQVQRAAQAKMGVYGPAQQTAGGVTPPRPSSAGSGGGRGGGSAGGSGGSSAGGSGGGKKSRGRKLKEFLSQTANSATKPIKENPWESLGAAVPAVTAAAGGIGAKVAARRATKAALQEESLRREALDQARKRATLAATGVGVGVPAALVADRADARRRRERSLKIRTQARRDAGDDLGKALDLDEAEVAKAFRRGFGMAGWVGRGPKRGTTAPAAGGASAGGGAGGAATGGAAAGGAAAGGAAAGGAAAGPKSKWDQFDEFLERATRTAEGVSNRATHTARNFRTAHDDVMQMVQGHYKKRAQPPALSTGQKVALAGTGAGGLYLGHRLTNNNKPFEYQRVQ